MMEKTSDIRLFFSETSLIILQRRKDRNREDEEDEVYILSRLWE